MPRRHKKHFNINEITQILQSKFNNPNLEIIDLGSPRKLLLSRRAILDIENVLFDLLNKYFKNKKLNQKQFKFAHKTKQYVIKETNDLVFCVKVRDEIRIIIVPDKNWRIPGE